MKTIATHRRSIWTTLWALVVLLGVVVAAPPAGAEIVPGVTTYWGVTGLATGTTTDSIDSEVWAIEQIGNRIYVGGRFTDVTNQGIDNPRPYIAAFNSVTGVWIDTWTPPLNGAVYALQASPDGSRLFVGGEFSQYGAINVKGLVALDPQTGAVDWGFGARVSGGASPTVKALDIEGNWLYVAGEFDFLRNNGVGPALSNVGRVNLSTGVVDSTWTPDVIGGAVWGVDASPTSQNIYLAGRFDSVGGLANTEGFAAVNDAGLAIATGYQKNNNTHNYIQDVETVNGLVFIGGSQHMLSVYNESDWSLVVSHHTNGDYHAVSLFRDANYGGTRSARGDGLVNTGSLAVGDNKISSIQVADGYTATVCTSSNGGGTCIALNGFHPTLPAEFDDEISSVNVVRNEPGPDGRGGDYQDIEVVGDRVYASCHCWGDHYSDSEVRNWDLYETPKGTWADAQWVHAYSATTGELIDTFKSGTTNTGTGPWAIHGATNGCLWVGGGVTGSGGQPANGFVRLCDGELDTTAPSAVTGLTVAGQGADSVDLIWNAATDDVGVTGYGIYDNASDALITTTTGELMATVTNLAPGMAHSFYVKAFDGAQNQGPRSNTVTVNLGSVGGPIGCVADNVGTAATLTWDSVVDAQDYRITRSIDGSTYWWRGITSETTFDDTLRTSGMHSYQVQARGSNQSWSEPTPCAPDLDPTAGLASALPPATCSATNTGLLATISWDQSANAVNYRIRRSVDGSPVFWRGSTTGISFTDILRSSGLHAYDVQARGPDGQWSTSTPCDPPLDTTPPSAPSPASCSATNVGTAATLTWAASANATDYRLYRAVDGGASYWRGLTSQTTFNDLLRNSGLHTYSVAARGGDGVWSAPTPCSPALDPTAGLSGASPVEGCTLTTDGLDATITWAAATNAIDYRVNRSVDGGAFFWRGVTTNLSFSDTLRDLQLLHIYEVMARGEDGVWSAPTQCQ